MKFCVHVLYVKGIQGSCILLYWNGIEIDVYRDARHERWPDSLPQSHARVTPIGQRIIILIH